MDGNPIAKPYCNDCKYWEPVGFYTWMREENPKMRECKHLKRCERVNKLVNKPTGQMTIEDFIKG